MVKESSDSMKIYLLRHGQTDWNLEGKMQGRKDIPMNDTGIKQMMELSEHLRKMNFHVDFIISSPLNRAKESAKIVAETIGFEGNIVYDEDFIERSFGLAEGLVWTKDLNLNDEKYAVETVEDVCKRAKIAIDKYMLHEDISILIVAHGAILSAVKHVLSQGMFGYHDSSVPIIQGNILCCEINQNKKPKFYNLFK